MDSSMNCVTSDSTLCQEIQCNGSDTQNSYPVHAENVIIKPSELDDGTTASNKVKVSQISKYEWAQRYYFGNLVSCNNTYISYVLTAKDNNRDDTVRVINQQTSTRVLLKGFSQRIQDITFESLKSNKLACIDSAGTLHVFDIFEGDDCVKSKLILEIRREQRPPSGEKIRVVWAPNLLLPMDDDHETMIGISIGNCAEVYNVQEILKSHGSGKFSKNELCNGGVITIMDCHKKAITCLAFSPDMQVLATSSLDGDVKFWSLSLEHEKPSCLHEWDPHGGDPVTSLYFCDNLLISDDSSPFWRYLITGTAFNSVLKIWCAVKWECIQTISFSAHEDSTESTNRSTNSPRCLKVSLDLTAKYLLVSDIMRPVLYICQLHQDTEQEKTTVVSVSEFILRDPILSFSVLVAKQRKSVQRQQSDGNDDDLTVTNTMNVDVDKDVSNDTKEDDDVDDEGDDEEKNGKRLSMVKLFSIQNKALQKLSIKFNTITSVSLSSVPTNTSPSQEDLLSIRDALSDVDVQDTSSIMGESVTNSIMGGSSTISDVLSVSGAPLEASIILGDSMTSSITLEESKGPSEEADIGSVTLTSAHDSNSALTDITRMQITPENRLSTQSPVQNQGEESTHLVSSSSPELVPSGNLVNEQEPLMSLSLREEAPSIRTDPPETIGKLSNGSHEEDLLDISSTLPPTLGQVTPPTLGQSATTVTDYASGAVPETSSNVSSMQDVYTLLVKQQEMLIAQQRELGDLKELVQYLAKTVASGNSGVQTTPSSLVSDEDSREEIKVHMQLLQKSATSQFSKANKEFNKQCNQRLEQFTKDVNANMQSKEERLVQMLSNIVNNTIAMKLEKTVKSEMKQSVVPAMDRTMSNYFENIEKQVAQKLSIWERTLREETSQLIKSKSISESIGYAAASILEGTIPNAYRETFQNILLPGFEKASMAMFMQINQTFQQGTKQYLDKLESHLESKQQRQQQLQEPMIQNLHDLVKSFQGTADRLTSGVEANLEALMQKHLREATDRMQNTFGKTIESRVIPSLSNIISHSVEDAFKDWKARIDASLSNILKSADSMSHSLVEDDTEKKKALITDSITKGDLYTAFEAALSASDLEIVLFTCQQVDPVELFKESSMVLPQPIILSLIQQLSQNLIEDIDLKVKYLEESIMALNLSEEITRTHMPGILKSLNDQLSATIEHLHKTDSSNKQIKPLRMLLMASRSLLHGD